MNPEVLFFGGSGFIGSHVSKILSNWGRALAIVYHTSIRPEEAIKGVLYIKISDVAKYSKGIKTVLIATPPDPIIFATISSCLSGIRGLNKIIYLSTLQLYPDSICKHNEEAPIYPISEYEKKKYYEELLLGLYINNRRKKVCIERFSNVYAG